MKDRKANKMFPDLDNTVRTYSMRINIEALTEQGIDVQSVSDADGNLKNVYIVFEQSQSINTNILYKQLIQAGLTSDQANEIVESMLKSANTRLMYNAIEETQHSHPA